MTAPTHEEAKQAAKKLGQRSYAVRLKRFGIARIREIARRNGEQHKPQSK